MSLRIIDTSSYQSALNLLNVDYDGVVVKATEGTGYVNPYCDAHIQESITGGKVNGVYHFARPEWGNDPIAEADWFLQNITGYLDGTTFLALDFETNTNVAWARAWLDHVFEKTGVRPVIYLSSSTVNAVDWSSVYCDYGLWVAQYRDNIQDHNWDMSLAGNLPDVNWNNAAPYVMWQWTSHGMLNGFGGELDLSIFYGDKDTWLLYARDQRQSAPAPVPTPPPAPVPTPAPTPAPVPTPIEVTPVPSEPVVVPVTTPTPVEPATNWWNSIIAFIEKMLLSVLGTLKTKK